MKWELCLICSALIIVTSVILAIIKANVRCKSIRRLIPKRILFFGTVLSTFVLVIPITVSSLDRTDCGIIEILFESVHNAVSLFIQESDLEKVLTSIGDVPDWVFRGYTVLFSAFMVFAPLVTVDAALSYFRNFNAYKSFWLHFCASVYVFSELNEKSYTLAKSIASGSDKNRFIVFAGVIDGKDDATLELLDKADELGAVCFKKDIVEINFGFHSKRSGISFFAISNNDADNVQQALKLIERYKYREETNLYVFSISPEADIILSNVFAHEEHDRDCGSRVKIKLRRINEVSSLINRTLYDVGYESIFESAYPDGSGCKHINAIVLGMGHHGTEMTKALAWFCQMDGYKLEVNSFELNVNAEETFKSLCPELMSEDFNGHYDIEGETAYKITVHSGVDVNTESFDKMLASMPRTTYAFVSLGSDELNIAAAVKLRSMFEKLGQYPVIHSIVYNSETKLALEDAVNFKNQPYGIRFIGGIRDSYSESCILKSDVEDAALKRHLVWGDEDSFWQYEYNYRSSVASAIHSKMKRLCGISGAEKSPDERTEQEKRTVRVLEHRRWNAYMRSIGYEYAGTTDPSGRNDMAKLHHCLTAFDQLPPNEQEKDDD